MTIRTPGCVDELGIPRDLENLTCFGALGIPDADDVVGCRGEDTWDGGIGIELHV